MGVSPVTLAWIPQHPREAILDVSRCSVDGRHRLAEELGHRVGVVLGGHFDDLPINPHAAPASPLTDEQAESSETPPSRWKKSEECLAQMARQ